MGVVRAKRVGRVVVGMLLVAGFGLATTAQVAVPTDFEGEQAGGDPAAPWAWAPAVSYAAGLPTPEEFLGYPLGSRFTRHDDVVAYFHALDEASDRVVVREYGRTNEGRPLVIATIGSAEHIADLERIKAANRRLADPGLAEGEAEAIIRANPAIAWLSFSVHGNEASTVEAALVTAYTLAAAEGVEADALRAACVTVIDPCINPDGRMRYVAHYDQTVGRVPNPAHAAAEHHEPWPGGRTNHYYFDLNRDWVWLTQVESRARLPVYREYMPQLHVDNHEQGYDSPFFFGAGEKPYNRNLPQETVEWVHVYGGSGAERFDEDGLLFATEERFDYLYPGYGKVLPCYHGAIGLLNEKAGHGFAGVAVEVTDTHTLTLVERTRHHFILNMAFVQTTADRREEQLARFRRFFVRTIEDARATPETYFVLPESDAEATARMLSLCGSHGIVVERLEREWDAPGLMGYRDGQLAASGTLPEGTLVIRTDQAMGRLARALFERSTFVEELETYDITAWSVPVAFGLEARYSREAVAPPVRSMREGEAAAFAWDWVAAIEEEELDAWRRPEGVTAWMIDAGGLMAPALMGAAIDLEISLRLADAPITMGEEVMARGSLIVHALRNEERALGEFLRRAEAMGCRVVEAATGLPEDGPALGNNANRGWVTPRIGLIRGGGDANSFGHHWHMLDQDMRIPHTVLAADQLSESTLDDLNVIVLADATSIGGAALDRVKAWVQGGGTLVATGSSAAWASATLLELKDEQIPGYRPDDRPALSTLTFAQRRQRRLEDSIPGAMLSATLDTTHPLTVGMGEWVGVLKEGGRRLPVGAGGYVVAWFDSPEAIGGLMSSWSGARIAQTPLMTVHSMGGGWVICFSDDLTMRGFFVGPRRLLLNAILMGPSL